MTRRINDNSLKSTYLEFSATTPFAVDAAAKKFNSSLRGVELGGVQSLPHHNEIDGDRRKTKRYVRRMKVLLISQPEDFKESLLKEIEMSPKELRIQLRSTSDVF